MVKFDLTPALMDDILDALETQGKRFCVTEAGGIESVDADAEERGEKSGVFLPQWGSERGYEIREEFVKHLHAPAACVALQEALHTGRGAFRAFKDTLKAYPQVERLWHRYKRQRLSSYVWNWYDGLCDEWGIPPLAHADGFEAEEESLLLHEDFIFDRFDIDRDMDGAEKMMLKCLCEGRGERADDVAKAIVARWHSQLEARHKDGRDEDAIICRTIDGAQAGCVTGERDRVNRVVFVTGIAVAEEWRGLGIASALMDDFMAVHRGEHFTAVLPVTGDALEGLLKKSGFMKSGTLWVANA